MNGDFQQSAIRTGQARLPAGDIRQEETMKTSGSIN
jgi:hypothetical protein